MGRPDRRVSQILRSSRALLPTRDIPVSEDGSRLGSSWLGLQSRLLSPLGGAGLARSPRPAVLSAVGVGGAFRRAAPLQHRPPANIDRLCSCQPVPSPLVRPASRATEGSGRRQPCSA